MRRLFIALTVVAMMATLVAGAAVAQAERQQFESQGSFEFWEHNPE
jgi:hypothetical protein